MKRLFILTFLTVLLSGWVQAQTTTVSGTVTDATDGTPLVGVTVLETLTGNGVLSGDDGTYTIAVEPSASLKFSYYSYAGQVLEVGTETRLDIQLRPDFQDLDEVVIVGYTSQEKKDITGAISIVDLEEIENSPYSNVLQSLAGKATGVSLTQDGQPGSGRTNIKIRGITTLNNNQPLYVIDGVPTVEDLSNLNPNDIESIQVLKDAASASIYGSRSAGGVIVITTKKGKAGKLSLDAGTQVGVQTLGNRLEVLNATEWGEVYWRAAQNDGLTPNHPLYGNGATSQLNTNPFLIPNGKQVYQITAEGTDWYDEVYQNAISQQHFVNISNGNKLGTFMAGFSYFDQDGLIKETYFDRITGRFNSTMNITPWLTVGENMSITFSEQVQIGSQQGQDGIPLDVIRQHPALPVYDLEGNFAGKISGLPDVRNMVSVLEKNRNNTTDSWRVFGNAYAQMDIMRMIPSISNAHSLVAKTSFGVDYSNFYDVRFNAAFSEGDFDIQNNFLFNQFGKGITTTWTNTLQYQLNQGKHQFQAMGGIEGVRYDFTFINGARTGFEIELPSFTYLSAGSGDQTNAGGGTQWGLYSYFGRTDYTFADKYIVSATIRYDQTSRLNTTGFFPAASIGWWISEEDFFRSFAGKSTSLKIRASYGQQGNQNIADFAILSTLGPDQNHADYDLSGTNSGVDQGFVVLGRGNPNLRWETTEQTNIGFDLLMWDGRFSVIADFYTKTTNDILLRAPQLAAVGEGTEPFVNAATVKNNGIDLGIGYRFDLQNGFGMDANLNLTWFTNEVISLGENIGNVGAQGELYLNGGDGPTRITVGYPIGVFYGWQADGIFQNEGEVESHADQPGKGVGRIRYADLNDDGVVNDDDRTYIGDPYPDLSFGLNLISSYKAFSLGIAMYGAVGQEVYNEVKWYMDFAQVSNFNRSTRILDAWSPENPTSTIPAPTLSNANNENRASSYFVEAADFLRVRSIRLSYDLPQSLTKEFRITAYAEGQNIWTLTNYSGVDPEVPFAGNANFPGIDRGVYPLPRTILLGLNFSL